MEPLTDIKKIRHIIYTILLEEGGGYTFGDLKNSLITSADENRFVVIRTGWYEGENFYALLQDVEIKDGIIYIHQDNQEDDVAEEFTDAGIDPSTIVKTYPSSYKPS